MVDPSSPEEPSLPSVPSFADDDAPANDDEPIKPTSRGLFEGSIPSIVFIFLSIVLSESVISFVVPHYKLEWMFVRERAGAVAVLGATPQPKTPLAILLTELFALVLLGGGFVALASVPAVCMSRDVRAWFTRQIGWLAVRPLPAIHLLDFIAVFLVWRSHGPVMVILLHSTLDLSNNDLIFPIQMVSSDLAMAVAVGAALVIAWFRARGMHGSLGFWPAWSGSHVKPAQPIWHDVLLGLACYPLMLWLATLVAYQGKFLVKTPDKHFIIQEFARHPRPLVIAIYLVTGTLGAAFFEETIFRGILYNALRRFLGGPFAALAAAFFFAYGHGLKSDLFPLFVLGLIMTWLYDKTGRLVAGMTFHFTNNMMSMIMTMALYNQ